MLWKADETDIVSIPGEKPNKSRKLEKSIKTGRLPAALGDLTSLLFTFDCK